MVEDPKRKLLMVLALLLLPSSAQTGKKNMSAWQGIEGFTEKDLNSILPKQAVCQEVLAITSLGAGDKKIVQEWSSLLLCFDSITLSDSFH